MAAKSQELALALLREAKEQGTLDSSVEAELAELMGTASRLKVRKVVESEKRELTPAQAEGLISTLKSRFEKSQNKKLRKAVDFGVLEKSLRAAPEKLYALQKLEETGGEPQLIALDGKEFVFEERSKESPSGRRNLDFDQSLAQAGDFGANMQSPDSYRAMQKTGLYDLETGSWLETDPAYRLRTGFAMYGRRSEDVVDVHEDLANDPYPHFAWRASLRVKKV